MSGGFVFSLRNLCTYLVLYYVFLMAAVLLSTHIVVSVHVLDPPCNHPIIQSYICINHNLSLRIDFRRKHISLKVSFPIHTTTVALHST